MYNMPTFRNHVSVPSSSLLPAFEDGTDTWFRNVGILYIDAGEIPKRTYTIFKSRRKLEIYRSRINCNGLIFWYKKAIIVSVNTKITQKKAMKGVLISEQRYVSYFVIQVIKHSIHKIILTHCGRVGQICVFNTVKLGTSESSP